MPKTKSVPRTKSAWPLPSKTRPKTSAKKLVVFDENARQIIEGIRQKGADKGDVWAPDGEAGVTDSDGINIHVSADGARCKEATRGRQAHSLSLLPEKKLRLSLKHSVGDGKRDASLPTVRTLAQAPEIRTTSPLRMHAVNRPSEGVCSLALTYAPEKQPRFTYKEYTCVQSREQILPDASKVWMTEKHTFRRVVIEAGAPSRLWRRDEPEPLGATVDEDDLQVASLI